MELGGGHLLQILQVGMEESTPDEGHPQQGFHNIANGAVIGKPYAFSCAHEVSPAAKGRGPGDSEQRLKPAAGERADKTLPDWAPSLYEP